MWAGRSSALPYKYASTLIWKDLFQEEEFGALEYQVLGFSVETANKGPFGIRYKVCFRDACPSGPILKIPFHVGNQVNVIGNLGTKVSALPQTCHHLCLSFQTPLHLGHIKLLHAWPKRQSHSALSCPETLMSQHSDASLDMKQRCLFSL